MKRPSSSGSSAEPEIMDCNGHKWPGIPKLGVELWDKKVTWRGEMGRQGKPSRKAGKSQNVAAVAERGWDHVDTNV